MAKADYTFWSNGNGTSGPQGTYITNQGGSSEVGKGNPLINSSLSNPLDSTIGSTHCRAWSWDKVESSSNAGNDRWSYCFGGMLTSAAGGALYPVTDTPSNGTLVSQSMRAFLRIESHDVDENVRQGINFGFTFKGPNGTGTQSNYYNKSRGADPTYGYHVSLGTLKMNGDKPGGNYHMGYENLSFGEAPRIMTTANKAGSSSTNNNTFLHASGSGTYAFDTWYHVRADLIPAVSGDTIKVYTAPVSGDGSAAVAGLGLETWTEISSNTIASDSEMYIPWDDSDYKYAGFWVVLGSDGTRETYGRHVPMIDKFQFLSKDIS